MDWASLRGEPEQARELRGSASGSRQHMWESGEKVRGPPSRAAFARPKACQLIQRTMGPRKAFNQGINVARVALKKDSCRCCGRAPLSVLYRKTSSTRVLLYPPMRKNSFILMITIHKFRYFLKRLILNYVIFQTYRKLCANYSDSTEVNIAPHLLQLLFYFRDNK